MQLNKKNVALLAIMCSALWGSAFVLAKEVFYYLLPLRVSAYRFMIAGIMLFPILFINKYDFKILKKQFWFFALLGLVQCIGQYGLFFWGLSYVPSAISSIIVGSMPLFVAALAVVFIKTDTISVRKVISIIFGVIGVIVIALDDNISVNEYPDYYIGIGLLILSNLAAAMSNVMVAKFNQETSIVAMSSVSSMFGGFVLYLLSFWVEPENTMIITDYPLSFFVEMFCLSLIPAITLTIWFVLVKFPGVVLSDLNIWKFLIPVFGVLSSCFFLPDEKIDVYELFGIFFITSSILVLNLRISKNKYKQLKNE